ncbi:hypothetical protein PVAND_007936 [Polypedilum vanderplanki]|uniref:Peptidase S1 domain-containing protein n=1 Tax=Polypedilum vanderplanki TaxID=319348 RepID=A0A9J6C7V9_POLVA|nr:hypothetical protein PVAND_007936 [Polypedilum vanderplanki]
MKSFLFLFSLCVVKNSFAFFSNKIINGQLAVDGQFPHMVQFSIKTHNLPKYCGGSLITDQWVLTAAHCFKGFEMISAKAYLGSVYWRKMPVKTKVIEIVTHPSYVNINGYDIALVKLEKKINFTDTIQPVSLPSKSQSRSENTLLVPGFGETKNASQSILHLRYARMREISEEECSFDWGWKMKDSHLCAVGVENINHTTCKGDSGNSIVEQSDNGSVALGIVSFGNPGCLGKPKVFTRISSYLDFIHEVTGRNIEN